MISLLLCACSVLFPRKDAICAPGAARACYEAGKSHLRGQPPQFDLALAAARFEMACSDGHPEACLELGLLVQDGRGTPQDYERAIVLYRRVCDAGYGVGCLNLSFMHQLGNGVPADEAKARKLVQEALDHFQVECAGEKPRYCANLGYVLENGFGVALADPNEAAKAYERGCTAGDPDACVNASQLGLERGRMESREALERLEKACGAGGAMACGALGQLYWTQRFGIEQDASRALSLFSVGCELGDAQSCLALGELLTTGGALEPRPVEALSAARRACWLGRSDGCLVVAKDALGAWQGSKDPARAQEAGEFLGTACRIGDAGACGALGALIAEGALGPPDPDLAMSAFREACRRLDYGACIELARAGRPLPLVEPAASDFLMQACQRGVQEACQQLGVAPVPAEGLPVEGLPVNPADLPRSAPSP